MAYQLDKDTGTILRDGVEVAWLDEENVLTIEAEQYAKAVVRFLNGEGVDYTKATDIVPPAPEPETDGAPDQSGEPPMDPELGDRTPEWVRWQKTQLTKGELAEYWASRGGVPEV